MKFKDGSKIQENVLWGPLTWFKVGGVVKQVFRAASLEDLLCFLENNNLKVKPIGASSNIILSDQGYNGVFVKLIGEFNRIIQLEEGYYKVGGGILNFQLAEIMAQKGRSGCEFFATIPGCLGAAVRTNAGCYGSELKDILLELTALNLQDFTLKSFKLDELGLAYRHTSFPNNWLVLDLTLKTEPSENILVLNKMQDFLQKRRLSQPNSKTCGSLFKNPPSCKAWQLIEQAGCRGLRIGDAIMSEKHANFMINLGSATSKDLVDLGTKVQKMVQDNTGITLEWEVERVGC